MKICSSCILPETFPGISFNADGVCNYCRNYRDKNVDHSDEKKRYEQKFLDLLKQLAHNRESLPGTGAYDVLMSYSGGKDSTYTLILLKKKYNLNVLAVTLDNGFISETARTNIQKVTDTLGADHIFFKPQWNLLRNIFTVASQKEFYPKKTLERASTICTSCMGIVKAVCLKMAIESGIPMIGYGWSPGQAPVQSSIMKNNPSLCRIAQQAILQPLREVAGDEIGAYFLQEKHYSDNKEFPYNIHPLAWEFYDEDMILSEIKKYGWIEPRDTDTNSTNCLLNSYANEVHIKKYGFHPYVWEIANMVRQGVMNRGEGYQKIYQEQPENLMKFAKEKLFAEC
jgi:tRNA(Ile)-lysidine synthase TilS/MesJ